MKSNINNKITYIHVNVIRTTIQYLHIILLQIWTCYICQHSTFITCSIALMIKIFSVTWNYFSYNKTAQVCYYIF